MISHNHKQIKLWQFAKEHLLDRCQETETAECNYNKTLRHRAGEMRNRTSISGKMKLNIDMCLLYMDTLPIDYPDTELVLNKKIENKIEPRIER